MKKTMSKIMVALLLIFSLFSDCITSKVNADTPNFGSSIYYSFDGNNYNSIPWNSITDINLRTTSTMYVQTRLAATSDGTLTNNLWTSIINSDASGNEWFTFADYPKVSGSSELFPLLRMTYTTDGTNYSDTKPALSDLKGVKVTLNGTLNSPESDGTSPFVTVTAPLIPKADYIINSGMVNQPMFPIRGQFSIFYSWSIQEWFYSMSPSMNKGQFRFLNPIIVGDVTVKYVDTDGNKISDDVVKTGNVGDSFNTEQKVIDGYTFKEVQGNASGTFTDQAQTVTYIYTKDPVAGGDVTAKYVDTDGNKISDDVVKTGNIDDPFNTEQKVIDGYTFKEVQGNASGTFTDQAQTVTYIYTKDPVAGGDVTTKYVDTDGNKISYDVVKLGNVGDAYTTEQKMIDGYTFKEVQGNASGTFTDQAQAVTYVYTKNNVTPSPKPDDHSDATESSKVKGKKKDSTSENKNTLPQTGDNDGLSMIGMISGLFLVFWTIVMILFKRKRQD
ncbi:MucBP domain-containing protein [Lactococcus lactis]|uniref:LPXTG-motif cell wall-anchored protein n=1 Tax=Lactococcus lactis TaxID=1358 RepID=A0AAW5TWI2_9LACT|nr:MucBP domain-containing protein [Lactococcus lactis]MCW2281964.1 LPXTG-motif cell wall-anchored protein [Lactococcus lactis]